MFHFPPFNSSFSKNIRFLICLCNAYRGESNRRPNKFPRVGYYFNFKIANFLHGNDAKDWVENAFIARQNRITFSYWKTKERSFHRCQMSFDGRNGVRRIKLSDFGNTLRRDRIFSFPSILFAPQLFQLSEKMKLFFSSFSPSSRTVIKKLKEEF